MSDNFQASFSESPGCDKLLLLRRTDPADPKITKDSFALDKHEYMILFETLMPEFEDWGLNYLIKKGRARVNHDISNPLT